MYIARATITGAIRWGGDTHFLDVQYRLPFFYSRMTDIFRTEEIKVVRTKGPGDQQERNRKVRRPKCATSVKSESTKPFLQHCRKY